MGCCSLRLVSAFFFKLPYQCTQPAAASWHRRCLLGLEPPDGVEFQVAGPVSLPSGLDKTLKGLSGNKIVPHRDTTQLLLSL